MRPVVACKQLWWLLLVKVKEHVIVCRCVHTSCVCTRVSVHVLCTCTFFSDVSDVAVVMVTCMWVGP